MNHVATFTSWLLLPRGNAYQLIALTTWLLLLRDSANQLILINT